MCFLFLFYFCVCLSVSSLIVKIVGPHTCDSLHYFYHHHHHRHYTRFTIHISSCRHQPLSPSLSLSFQYIKHTLSLVCPFRYHSPTLSYPWSQHSCLCHHYSSSSPFSPFCTFLLPLFTIKSPLPAFTPSTLLPDSLS